jgi:hypothetical protein
MESSADKRNKPIPQKTPKHTQTTISQENRNPPESAVGRLVNLTS